MFVCTDAEPTPWTGEELCPVPWEAFPIITLTLAEMQNSTFDIEISPTQYLRAVGYGYAPTEEDCYKFAVASSKTFIVLSGWSIRSPQPCKISFSHSFAAWAE